MDKRLILFLGFALITTLSMQAQDDDDMYFVPTKKQTKTTLAATVERQEGVPTKAAVAEKPHIEVYNNNSRSDDEYNRRNTNYAGSWQTGGGDESDSLNSLAAEVESVDNSQYDMEDPELDYIYSRRLLRFHSPRFGFALSSPYYWDLVYGYGIYDYLYDPFYDYYYDPFFYDYGWGFGWSWGPWNSWYGPIWGWNHPHGWDAWGAGPMWRPVQPRGGEMIGMRNSRSWNRGTFTQNRFSNNSSIVRTSALASANGSRNIVASSHSNSTNRSMTGRVADITNGNASERTSAANYNTRASSSRYTVDNNRYNTGIQRTTTTTDRTSALRYNQQTNSRTNTQLNTRTSAQTQTRTYTPTTTNRTTTTTTTTRSYTPTTVSRTSAASSYSGAGRSSGGGFSGGSVSSGASRGGGSVGGGRR